VDDIELVRDKSVVAVVAFRQTTIYPTDASPGQRPEHVVATDPGGRFQKVHHQAGNPGGTYEADSPDYWREVNSLRCIGSDHRRCFGPTRTLVGRYRLGDKRR
jgi:hypothetical protein